MRSSLADGLRLVTLVTQGGTRDKSNNVCVGGYVTQFTNLEKSR